METLEDLYLAGRNPEYDANAKKLLASRKILAWILKYCVPEFEDSTIEDIRDIYIQGTPEVASVPVMPDKTNARPLPRILGENTEDKTLTEGTVTFDIRFRASTPDGSALGLIINVEAQHSASVSYPLVTRALYYVSRLISSQHDVDFDKSHYEKIRKVYSIWLCMDPPGDESGITQYRVQENLKYGMIGEEEKHYDLAQAVMVYISSKKRDPGNRLLRLLYELFKSDDNAAGKMKTLENDYQIKLNESEEGMVDIMCNLSVGIAKAGVDKGYLLGRQDGRIEGVRDGVRLGKAENQREITVRMLENHMPLEIIVRITGQSEDDLKRIAEEESLPC